MNFDEMRKDMKPAKLNKKQKAILGELKEAREEFEKVLASDYIEDVIMAVDFKKFNKKKVTATELESYDKAQDMCRFAILVEEMINSLEGKPTKEWDSWEVDGIAVMP